MSNNFDLLELYRNLLVLFLDLASENEDDRKELSVGLTVSFYEIFLNIILVDKDVDKDAKNELMSMCSGIDKDEMGDIAKINIFINRCEEILGKEYVEDAYIHAVKNLTLRLSKVINNSLPQDKTQIFKEWLKEQIS